MNTAQELAEAGERYLPIPAEISLLSAVRWPTLRPERGRSRSARHRGFRIVARPYRLSGSGLWTVDVEIHHGAQRRSYSEATRYLTEGEASDHSLELGRQIIDGKMPPWSTNHLRGSGRRFAGPRRVARIMLVGVAACLLLAGVGDRNPHLTRRATRLADAIYSATVGRIVTIGQNLYASVATGP